MPPPGRPLCERGMPGRGDASRFAVLALVSALVAGCGNGTPAAGSTSTTPPAVTTQAGTTVPAISTSSTTSSSSITSTTTTSTSATTTTIEDDSSPFRADGTLRSLPPAEYFPSAATGTAADVPWDEVGPDWILTLIDKAGRDANPAALLLIDPADQVYLLGGWDTGSGALLQDWSPDGRRILYTGAPTGNDTVVLELLDGDQQEIQTPYRPDVARFTRPTGREVVIGRLWGERSFIDVYRTNTTLWSHLLETVGSPEPSPLTERSGWLYHQAGMHVVVSDGNAVWLSGNRGDAIRRLPIDGIDCVVRRWWSEDEALVSCTDPQYAETEIYACWPGSGRELWAVPIDGSTPRPVGPQAGPGGACDVPGVYGDPREDALAVGSTLLIERSGCCECGVELELWNQNALMPVPELRCLPQIIGIRNGDALISVVIPGVLRSGIAQVAVDGSTRIVAPELWEEASVGSVHLTDDAPGSG